jgi:hypothetical protein
VIVKKIKEYNKKSLEKSDLRRLGMQFCNSQIQAVQLPFARYNHFKVNRDNKKTPLSYSN